MDKIDPLVSLAPVLVTRLKGLKNLHAEAAIFSDSIKMISSEQTKISEEMKALDNVSTKVIYCSFFGVVPAMIHTLLGLLGPVLITSYVLDFAGL